MFFSLQQPQEQVAFFGYHHAVGQCKGDPFVIASTGLEQIEAWTSKDHEGIALRLRPGMAEQKLWMFNHDWPSAETCNLRLQKKACECN